MLEIHRDLFRLQRLNWKFGRNESERAERRALLLKLFGNLRSQPKQFLFALFGFLVHMTSAAGAFCAVLLGLVALLLQPFLAGSATVAALTAITGASLIPKLANSVRERFGITPITGLRLVLVLACFSFASTLINEKHAARLAAMTPEQRERDQERERANEAARLAAIQKEQDERSTAEALKKYEATERARADETRREASSSNKEQRRFYDDLGAPKLLYRCEGRELEKAIGAKYGSINSLLDEANKDCIGKFEILKRKD
jgi:hypothetical protein